VMRTIKTYFKGRPFIMRLAGDFLSGVEPIYRVFRQRHQ
jgi:hypothetical protein